MQPRGRPQGVLNRRIGPAQAGWERSQFRAAQNRGANQAIYKEGIVGVNIEEERVQAQEYVDILLLLKLPHPALSIKFSLVSVCNFKNLIGGGAKMGSDGCIKGVDRCIKVGE